MCGCMCMRVCVYNTGRASGAHTTCCEERPVLLLVFSPAPGALLARLIVPGLVHRHPGSASYT